MELRPGVQHFSTTEERKKPESAPDRETGVQVFDRAMQAADRIVLPAFNETTPAGQSVKAKVESGEGPFTAEEQAVLAEMRDNLGPEEAQALADYIVAKRAQRAVDAVSGKAAKNEARKNMPVDGLLDVFALRIQELQALIRSGKDVDQNTKEMEELEHLGHELFLYSHSPNERFHPSKIKPGPTSDPLTAAQQRLQANEEAGMADIPLAGDRATGVPALNRAVTRRYFRSTKSRVRGETPPAPGAGTGAEPDEEPEIVPAPIMQPDAVDDDEEMSAPVPGSGSGPNPPPGERRAPPAPNPEPGPQPPPEPTPNERIRIGLAGRDEDRIKFAQEEANRMFHQELKKVPWFDFLRKAKLKTLEGYYKKKWEKEILEATKQNNNAYLKTEVVARWTKLGLFRRNEIRVVDANANKDASLAAGIAGGEQAALVEELRQSGTTLEGHQAVLMSDQYKGIFYDKVIQDTLADMRGIPAAELNSLNSTQRQDLEKVLQGRIQEFLKQVQEGTAQPGRDELLKYLSGNESFATNLISMLAEVQRREAQLQDAHKTALDIIRDQTDIVIGQIRWGAEDRRKRNWGEKLADSLHRRNVDPRVLQMSPLTTGILGSAAMAGVLHYFNIRGASTLTSHLLNFTPPFVGALTGGLTAYFRRGHELQQDRQLQETERAYGRTEPNGEKTYRGELEKFNIEMVSADTLVQQAEAALAAFQGAEADDGRRRQLLEAYFKIKDYLDLSAEKNINLIQFGGREVAAADRMKMLKALARMRRAIGNVEDGRLEIMATTMATSRGERMSGVIDDMDKKDKQFKKYARSQKLKALGFGMATGFVGGFVSQGILAGATEGWLQIAQKGGIPIGIPGTPIGTEIPLGNGIPPGNPIGDLGAAKITEYGTETSYAGEGLDRVGALGAIDIDIQGVRSPEAVIAALRELPTEPRELITGNLTFKFDGEGGVEIVDRAHGGHAFKAVVEGGALKLENASRELAEELRDMGLLVRPESVTFNQKEVLMALANNPDSNWHSSLGRDMEPVIKGIRVKIGGPTGLDRNIIEFSSLSEQHHVEARLDSNGKITFLTEPSAEIKQALSEAHIPVIQETIDGGEVVQSNAAIERLRSEHLIAPVDHTEYFTNNTAGSDGNELRFHTIKDGDALIIDGSQMEGHLSTNSSLSPKEVDVRETFNNGRGVVAFRFGNEIPGQQDTMVLAQLDENGQIRLDPNATDTVRVYQNGAWTDMNRGELSRIVLNEDYLNSLPDGNIATEATGRQEVFNLGIDNGRGAIHIGQLDPNPSTTNGGEVVFQSFSTIRGAGVAEVGGGQVWTAEPLSGTTLNLEVRPPALAIPSVDVDFTNVDLQIDELNKDAQERMVPMIATPLKKRRTLEYEGNPGRQTTVSSNTETVRNAAAAGAAATATAENRANPDNPDADKKEKARKKKANRMIAETQIKLSQLRGERETLEKRQNSTNPVTKLMNRGTDFDGNYRHIALEQEAQQARLTALTEAQDNPALDPEVHAAQAEYRVYLRETQNPNPANSEYWKNRHQGRLDQLANQLKKKNAALPTDAAPIPGGPTGTGGGEDETGGGGPTEEQEPATKTAAQLTTEIQDSAKSDAARQEIVTRKNELRTELTSSVDQLEGLVQNDTRPNVAENAAIALVIANPEAALRNIDTIFDMMVRESATGNNEFTTTFLRTVIEDDKANGEADGPLIQIVGELIQRSQQDPTFDTTFFRPIVQRVSGGSGS